MSSPTSATNPSPTPSSAPPTTPSVLTREHLQRAFRRWTTWFAIRTMSLIAIAVSFVWYCWDHPNEVINLKNRLSHIFSELGTSTLNQKELQAQATEYSKQMIKDVFNDESMQQETKKFFVQILSQQDFLDTILVLLQDLFARDVMIESVKQLVIDVFNDESVIQQCKILVGHAISAEENKQLLLKTLNEILDDQELTDHARDIANKTVKGVLDDEDIRKLSTMFLQHVLNDDAVQQSSSDTLYKILVDAFTPGMFKKKKKTATEETKHVAFQHIDVEAMEHEANEAKEGEPDTEGEGTEAEDMRQQMNQIDSVIGNHPS